MEATISGSGFRAVTVSYQKSNLDHCHIRAVYRDKGYVKFVN